MSDRTSAEIYGGLFERLAQQVREIWEEANCYDFHPLQMDCDDDLLFLGLARKDPDGETIYMNRTCNGWVGAVTLCKKKLVCGSTCVLGNGHDGGCECCGDTDGPGSCPA